MFLVKKYLYLILFCALNGSVYSQVNLVDSLKHALKNAAHDTTRCSVLNLIIEAEADDNIWPGYNEQLLQLSVKNESVSTGTLAAIYIKYHATALNNIGFLAEHKGDVSNALENYHKSLKLYENINDKLGIATSLSNIGTIYYDQNDINKALDYYYKSLQLREQINDKQGIAYSLQNIGVSYNTKGDKNKALEYYLKSLKIAEELQDKYGIANSLYIIGSIYKSQNNSQKALDYFNKSLTLDEEIQDKRGIANSLNNIASLKLKTGQINEALAYALKSQKTAKEIGYPENIRFSANTLKEIYKQQNKYKEAFEMFELEIRMRDSINNQETQKAAIKKQMQYSYEKKELEMKAEQDKKDVISKENLKQKEKERNYFMAGFAIVMLLAIFILRGYKQKQKANLIITAQKLLVEEKQKEILDSIRYAKRIQTSLLPSEKYIHRSLNKK
jgi:tetratricopeptide (TPR) repeat protein